MIEKAIRIHPYSKSRERAFQEREIKSIKALRQEHTWYILRKERKPIFLEYRGKEV